MIHGMDLFGKFPARNSKITLVHKKIELVDILQQFLVNYFSFLCVVSVITSIFVVPLHICINLYLIYMVTVKSLLLESATSYLLPNILLKPL